MTRKLCQVIAVEKTVKADANTKLTEAYQHLQKPALLAGIARSYTPKHEDGDPLPPESTRVQLKAHQVIASVVEALTRFYDVTATKEAGNIHALADVVVDGKTLMTGVSVPFLLFLEKQLVDLRTFILKLPTLDPAENWHYDKNTDAYATDIVQTVRTKKTPKNHIKAEATDKHPAQVELYYEDVPIGIWATTKFSGALPQSTVNEYLSRIEKLTIAVKHAREEANSVVAADAHLGESFFKYLFSTGA